MKTNNKTLKSLLFSVLGIIIGSGTYNALVINTSSDIKGHTSIKRLDEMYGNIKIGKSITNSGNWEKIQTNRKPAKESVATADIVSENNSNFSEPSIQESLELKLAEAINPKKWKKSLGAGQFSGNLVTNNGVIENMKISLPGMETVSASFTELSGNVFEYEYDGQVYSGLMYQVDQAAYMVTLTNGPLEGTRLRFTSESSQVDSQEYLANTHNIEVGNFGEENETSTSQVSPNNTAPADVATFNFGSKI